MPKFDKCYLKDSKHLDSFLCKYFGWLNYIEYYIDKGFKENNVLAEMVTQVPLTRNYIPTRIKRVRYKESRSI